MGINFSTSSVSRLSRYTAGAASFDSSVIGRASTREIDSGRLSASRFGTSSPRISDSTVITTTTVPMLIGSA